MTDEERIADLLLTWEEARERGNAITAEELCRGCPELLDTVRDRIRLLEKTAWMSGPAKPPQQPRTLAERYVLEALIGSGGYADVWRAYDLRLRRHVAAKVPRPSRTLTVLQIDEVLTEARQIACLKHVNIVTLHDVLKEGAGYVLVSDLIDGETLADRLRHGPMPSADVVKSAGDGGPRHRLCPRPGRRPPRPQTGEHPARPRRHPTRRRLRAGPAEDGVP
jgi:hypothetical protein